MNKNKFRPDPRNILGGNNLPIIGQPQFMIPKTGFFLHKGITTECTTFEDYLRWLLTGLLSDEPNPTVIQCRPAILSLWPAEVIQGFNPQHGLRFWNFKREELATIEEYGIVVSRVIPGLGGEVDSIAPISTDVPT